MFRDFPLEKCIPFQLLQALKEQFSNPFEIDSFLNKTRGHLEGFFLEIFINYLEFLWKDLSHNE